MILNAAATFSLDGATADVTEVRRLRAVELDDVHRRHGKARAIDHAADIAVERHIGEVPFGGLDFLGVLFGLVAQGLDVVVPEQRIAIERSPWRREPAGAVVHDDQRIDLEQAMSFSTNAL